jgi:hypothetical protein
MRRYNLGSMQSCKQFFWDCGILEVWMRHPRPILLHLTSHLTRTLTLFAKHITDQIQHWCISGNVYDWMFTIAVRDIFPYVFRPANSYVIRDCRLVIAKYSHCYAAFAHKRFGLKWWTPQRVVFRLVGSAVHSVWKTERERWQSKLHSARNKNSSVFRLILRLDFRFSRRRLWRWLSSGVLRDVVRLKFTDVSEVLAAAIFSKILGIHGGRNVDCGPLILMPWRNISLSS